MAEPRPRADAAPGGHSEPAVPAVESGSEAEPPARARPHVRALTLAALAAVAMVVLAACAAGANTAAQSGGDRAGFWLGLWQGLILPITFIISLFTDHVSIYEVNNNGNWYDFGYVLGAAFALSGSGRGACRSRRRRRAGRT